jgi:ribosome biogenesis protein MAK21
MGAGVDARVVSALLTGINRAFPYVDGDAVEPLVEKVSPALFAIAHSPNLGGALQALALLLQLLSARAAVSDRFYRALYAVLLHPGAPRGSSAAAGQLLSLTFRSLKDDPRPPRAAAVVKRLLQVAAHAPAPFACGALMLVSEFLKQKPSHWDAVRQPREGEEDDDVERFVDADDDDDAFDETRVSSKRKNDADADADSDSDSGDRDSGGRDARASETSLEVDEATASLEKAGDRAKRDASRRYDMSKRDPLYARADASCWWELSLLERNVHPSVAAMARSLLGGFSVEYSGDPLADMTLASFLDKWLQKKPKRLKQSRGGSETMAKRRGESGTAEAFAPGTREFAALAETEVDPSEVFFHRYYSARAEGADGKKKKKKEEDLDGDGDSASDSASDDDDAVAERRKKKAERAGIEGFDAEEDEADSDAEDVDLGDFEEDASDDEPSGARGGALAASGIDPKAAGFGDYDSDEDAAADREERREEEAADADAYRYDALVDAYGEKPGYLRRQMEAAALAEAEAGGSDDSDSEGPEGPEGPEGSEGSEGSEEEDDGVKVWEYEGSGSEEAVSGEDGSDGDDDDGASSDDGDEDLLDDAPEASDSDPAVTLTAAAPRGGGKGGADAFASLDDYRAMIDADFAEHPPARSDDEDDGGDGEEEKRSSAKKKRRAPGAGETASAKKSKKASPALTRGAAARRKKKK